MTAEVGTDAATERAEKTEKKDAADERIAGLEARLAEMGDMLERALGGQQPQAPQADFLDPDMVFDSAPKKAPKSVLMGLRELRAHEGPLYVRHNDPQRQFSCHQQLGEHRVDFDLGPKGSINGDDIAYLPKLALEIRGIQRAIMRGVITVSSDEAMEEEIMLAMGQHLHASEDQLASLLAPLEPGNNARDVVPKPCLVCGQYTRDPMTNEPSHVIQGGQVFQSYEDYKSGKPPLCSLHLGQEHLWLGTLVDNPETGIRDWVFATATTGASRPGIQPGMPQFAQDGPRARVRRVGEQQ